MKGVLMLLLGVCVLLASGIAASIINGAPIHAGSAVVIALGAWAFWAAMDAAWSAWGLE